MQSNVDHNIIQHPLFEAQKDGVQKIVVGAVIRKDNEFLLLERVPSDFMGGLVELPSGTVDTGEELLQALLRETQEETGLTITYVLAYISSFDYTSRSGKKTRQFNFLVEVAHGEVKLNPAEHQAHYFVAPTDEAFTTLNISDAVKKVLKTVQQQ